jgi:uncharacterized protein (TIGR02001 family)
MLEEAGKMKLAFVTTALIATALSPMLGSAQEAEISGNAGWVSEYYYRGIPQKTSSASAGLDLEVSGLYAGTWAADVGDGAEVDLYGGYVLDLGDLYLGVGGTGYFYTGDFDDTYLEANLYAGVGPLEVEFSIGRWDAEEPEDYWFLGVTGVHEGFYGTVGTFGSDFSGLYFEAGYEFEVAGLDMGISWIWSDEDLSGLGKSDNTLVFGISRTFDIR